MFTGNTWWGFADMVEFSQTSREYKKFLKDFLHKVLRYCDGIRLDVADSLSDEVLRYIRDIVKETEMELGKRIYILGEVWKNSVKGDYRGFLFGNELDAPMNYQFTDAIYRLVRWRDTQTFKQQIFDDVLRLYPKESIDVLMNPLSTHDIPRIPNLLTNSRMLKCNRFSNGDQSFLWDYDKLPCWVKDGRYQTLEKRVWEHENGKITDDKQALADKLQKLAVSIQYTLPGIPSIFAGDELGVTGLKDPFNRSCMPWEKVEASDMRKFYVKIGAFRGRYREIFAEGKCELVLLNEKICIYQRVYGTRKMLCIFNLTSQSVNLDENFDGEIVFSIYGSTKDLLNPYEAMFMYI
jgi:glycosidase